MTVTRTTARSVTQLMDDPINFFGQSYTQMHTIPRAELEELQRQAIGIRFQQHHRSIEMVRKLADRLGVTELNEFDDVVPLMFSHTAFKSYPSALIDKKRFDLMTRWLDKLTSYDLSNVDARGMQQHRRLDRPPRRADPASGDHVQRDDRNDIDPAQGQARCLGRHGAVEDLPVPNIRPRTDR